MLTALLTRLVRLCARRAWPVIVLSLLLTVACGWYAAGHFAINTDIDRLLESNAPWAQRDAAIGDAFPQRQKMILAVVRAPALEQADAAADALAAELRTQPQRFHAVDQPGGGDYFARYGLLFLSPSELDDMGRQLEQARPLINTLAHDPSLRGVADTVATILGMPLESGQVDLAGFAVPFNKSADTIEQLLAGKRAALSWSAMAEDAAGKPAASPASGGQNEKTRSSVPVQKPGTLASSFVAISPVLDYASLEAGADASTAIRAAAEKLNLRGRFDADVRLTGTQPLADEEFASVADGAALNGALTLLLVLVILWLALRSVKLIFAVLVNLVAGLIITAALGLAMVDALNMISVAFAMLFIGLGGDFGIQFGVRYRAERHRRPGGDDREALFSALAESARVAGMPLALAAAATAVAFFSFLPTNYRGVAELGQIAGVGMIVAFISTLTLLPALVAVLRPSGEPHEPNMRALAPFDHFFERHRQGVLIGTCVVILAGIPLLPHLRFDFDPLHLKDPHSESMATLLALADAPQAGTEDVSVLAPSLAATRRIVATLEKIPEVSRVTTLDTFIPPQQEVKLPRIAAIAASLGPALSQPPAAPASDALRVAALGRLADQLELAAEDHPGKGAAPAARLAKALRQLQKADTAARDRAERALALPLRLALARLRRSLDAQPVTLKDLPPAMTQDWITPDGRALIDIAPHLPAVDSPERSDALTRFLAAVEKAEPSVAGGPISIRGSADTIMTAFAQAGGWAVLSITVLLWITLRSIGDVLRTLVPLLVSTIVTLELCVVFGMPLNFANVIALPLLLGVGVAFKIYYVTAWRAGQTHLLQSSLTHAVLYSAATTAAAFGSLSLSHHPGTASMGRLLALSLACTLVGAVFFQPILLGKPRQPDPTTDPDDTDHPA
jgi:hopanoid biosynthesis associated RND transporter like protein HpnN